MSRTSRSLSCPCASNSSGSSLYLRRLFLRNFRNFSQLDLTLNSGITVLWGDNAQGKTNFLEAAYILATLKSFRGARNSDLVRSTSDSALVRGELVASSLPRSCEVEISSRGKRVRIDGKAPRSLPGYFETIKAVSFVPSDLRLIDGPPDGRRSFIDRAAFTMDPHFLKVAQDYREALRQKNALLRQGRRGGAQATPALLAIWNERLVASGSLVVAHRVRFLEEFAPIFREVHEGITDAAKGRAEISYRACVGADAIAGGRETIAQSMLDKTEELVDEELRRGFATWGPHRDDWQLTVGDEALRRFGSQGQVRSAALSLRVAQMVLARRKLGVCPLFLLDDVSSELDPQRSGQLMSLLGDLEAQVLITTTELSNIRLENGQYDALKVVKGTVSG